MATAAQIIANKVNAESSTGPRTEEGKAVTRFNSLRHGLTSTQLVLPHESQDEYDRHRADMLHALAPGSEHEQTLAERVVQTYWRMQRFYRVENAFLAARMDAIAGSDSEITDGDAALAMLFSDPGEMARTRLMLRYLTAAERAYNKAVADLEKAKKEGIAREREQIAVEIMQERANIAKSSASLKNGSASQAAAPPYTLPLPTPENTAPGGLYDPAFHLARLNQR